MTGEKKTEGETKPDELTKWKEKAQRYEAENEDFKRRYKGIDPDEHHALKQANDDLMKERADKGGQKERDEYKTELDKQYSKKIKDTEAERDEARAEANKYRVVIPAMTEVMKHINPDQAEFFQGLVEANFMEHEGEIVAKDADGKPLKSAKDPTAKMGIGEWIEIRKTKNPSSFKAEQIGGGKEGGTSSSVNKTGGGAVTFSDLQKMSKQDMKKLDPKQIEAAYQR